MCFYSGIRRIETCSLWRFGFVFLKECPAWVLVQPGRARTSGVSPQKPTWAFGLLAGCRELEDCHLVECLARLELSCWELRVVRRVGVVLCFQAECRPGAVCLAPFTWYGSVQEVPAIELNTRLGSVNLQLSPRVRIVRARRQLQPRPFTIQDVIDVITFPDASQ